VRNWQLVKVFKDADDVGIIKYSICKLGSHARQL